MKTLVFVSLSLLGSAFAASTASAGDYCRIYSQTGQRGSSFQRDLPAVNSTYNPNWYGSSSRRAVGSEASSAWYENGESVRIRAVESDVVFYVYDGDWMDGDFQAVRCEKGNTCNWTFGWMRNQMRSFNCQRESDGLRLPTNEMADALALELDQQFPQSSNVKNSWIRHGRMRWTNVRSRCERKDVGCKSGWEQKYNDVLEFSYKGELDIKPAIKHYRVWLDFWLHPQVRGADREFHIDETYWRVSVAKGVLQKKIRDGIVDQVKDVFDGGDDDVGEQVMDAIEEEMGPLAPLLLTNQQRVEFTYVCRASAVEDHIVRWPEGTYSDSMRSNPCGARTPSHLFAPQLRLVRRP